LWPGSDPTPIRGSCLLRRRRMRRPRLRP
jgi:hypothetical protein